VSARTRDKRARLAGPGVRCRGVVVSTRLKRRRKTTHGVAGHGVNGGTVPHQASDIADGFFRKINEILGWWGCRSSTSSW